VTAFTERIMLTSCDDDDDDDDIREEKEGGLMNSEMHGVDDLILSLC